MSQPNNTTLPPYPYPIDLTVYTPSVPCLHCSLVSSPRCSLLNLINHRDRSDQNRLPKFTPPWWYKYRYKPDIPLPIPGLRVRCSRCVRDGIEWCVLREMDGARNVAPMGGRVWMPVAVPGRLREGKGEESLNDGGKKETEEVSVTKELTGVGGRGHGGGAGGGNDEKRPLESLVIRARRIARLRKIREGSVKDEDVDRSFAPEKIERTVESGKSAELSTATPTIQQKSSTSLDLPDYDANSDGDNNNTNNNQNTDNESNTDSNASDSDAKSNVSSKTSLSKRSIKSNNSTTSPILTPSSPPPVKNHAESPPAPPPPSPPERIPSNYVLNKKPSWIWKPRGQEEVVLGNQKSEKKKWELNREEWTDHPLFAAVTAIKVTKYDLADLIYPETTTTRQDKKMEMEMEMTEKKRVKKTKTKKQTPGLKRFFNSSEIPFIAYVRTTGLEGRKEEEEEEEEEDLLQIVKTQIRDVMKSYDEQTDKRSKEAIAAAEGYLPLESWLGGGGGGGFLTQEDLQRQFALPSWRKRELEFLSEGWVKMRRRKEERRIQGGEIKEWVMGGKKRAMMEKGVRAAGGEKEDGEEQEEKKKKKENELRDQVQQTSQESDTSNPDPNLGLPPCTPTEYFSHRRHRLHTFWTQEAQPADFQYAKAIKRTTLRKWRGVKKKRYRLRWTTTTSSWSSSSSSSSFSSAEEEKDGRKTLAGWLAGYQQRKQARERWRQMRMEGSGADTGESPVPGGTGTRRKKKQTRQEWAEDDGNQEWEGGKGEEESDDERRILADDLELVTDASEDEDILRFLGDRCDDDDDEDDDVVGGEGGWIGSEGVEGDEDSYPLVDLVRESMMNEYY